MFLRWLNKLDQMFFDWLYKLYRRRPFKRFWRIVGQEDIRDLFKKSTWIKREWE
jgi:hypothetical protein